MPFLGMAAGAGLSVALTAGPVAVADTGTSPIDVWPYADAAGVQNTLPGFPADGSQGNPITFEHGGAPPTPWHTADVTSFGSYHHQEVTSVLDPSFGYPSVGTVADQYFIKTLVYNPTYPTEYTLYSNYYISDPDRGTGDLTTFFRSAFTNYYVSDTAGIEDQVSFFGGQPITLFEFPASDVGSSGAADLIGAAPGADLF